MIVVDTRQDGGPRSAAQPGADAGAVAVGVLDHPEAGRRQVADQPAPGVEHGLQPALPLVVRHPHVEVPPLVEVLRGQRGLHPWLSLLEPQPRHLAARQPVAYLHPRTGRPQMGIEGEPFLADVHHDKGAGMLTKWRVVPVGPGLTTCRAPLDASRRWGEARPRLSQPRELSARTR